MIDEERLRAIVLRALGSDSGWSVSVDQHVPAVVAEHPASGGMLLELRSEIDARTWEADVSAWLQDREFEAADAAPPLSHPDIVLGCRTLANAFEWAAAEVKAVAYLLYEAGAVSAAEAGWLAGYVAPDAEMRAEPPDAC